MKNILLISAILVGNLSILAQSLSITDYDGNNIDGSTLTVSGSNAPFSILSAKAIVKNNSGSAIDVKVKRYEANVTPASENYFCWFVCYGAMEAGTSSLFPTATDPQFPHFRSVSAGGADSSLVMYHKPENTSGTSIYRYVVFDGNAPNDSVWFHVEFIVGFDGIEDQPKIVTKHYPNPTEDVLNINLEGETNGLSMVITDILGKTIQTTVVNSSVQRIDVSGFNDGIYFYSIINARGILITKKFIVKH